MIHQKNKRYSNMRREERETARACFSHRAKTFCISIYLSIYPSIYHILLSIYLSIYLSFFLYIYISIYLAVKFGRMSKKQREKVEEEVSFHQANSRVNIYCYYLTWKTTFMRHFSGFPSKNKTSETTVRHLYCLL